MLMINPVTSTAPSSVQNNIDVHTFIHFQYSTIRVQFHCLLSLSSLILPHVHAHLVALCDSLLEQAVGLGPVVCKGGAVLTRQIAFTPLSVWDGLNVNLGVALKDSVPPVDSSGDGTVLAHGQN